MKILSHRGFWKEKKDANTIESLTYSFKKNFGIETDVRDLNQDLVISHDPPNADCILDFNYFISKINLIHNISHLPIAINVKSDGNAYKLKKKLEIFNNLDYFFFDMSIPDMRSYFKEKLPVFTRLSEFEKIPVFYNDCVGVWLDSFESNWFNNNLIDSIINNNKRVCIVSPELHSRSHIELWENLKPYVFNDNVMICTDFPEIAKKYFNL